MTHMGISRTEFIKSHYSDNKDDFYDKLISLWEQPLSIYISTEVKTKTKINDKWIIKHIGTKDTSMLKTNEILDIMLNVYSVQDLMLIINFTMRNRDKFEKRLGKKLNQPKHKGLKLITSEWNSHMKDPKTYDSLQELISQYRFRKKLEKELSNKYNNQKSSDYIKELAVDICKTYSIVAKIQQVRRLRKGSFRNSGNIELSDNIIANAWEDYESINSDNFDEIDSHCITPVRYLNFLIMMQHHLNNNRRYNPRHPSFDSPKLSNLEDGFGPEIKMIIDSTDSTPVWCEIYYWWYLRMRSKFFQRRLDRSNQSDFDNQIVEHTNSLTRKKQGYLKGIKKKEKKNLEEEEDNDLIHGFKELSEYLNKEMFEQKNIQKLQEQKTQDPAAYKLSVKRKTSSHINNKSTLSQAHKKSNEKISKLMSILMSDKTNIASGLTNIFISSSSSTKPICLEYDSIIEKYVSLNLVPRNKSSLINNCRNAIRNANLAFRHLQSTNDFKSLILQIIVLIQLIIKLRVNLQDSRIYRHRFQKDTKCRVWSDDRDTLEKELFDEFSKTLISIFENIQRQLENGDALDELLGNWKDIIEKIPDDLRVPNRLNPNHSIGRLGMLCDVLSSFLGLIDVSGDEQVKDGITLYMLTKADFLKAPLVPIGKKKAITITTEDLNLKPVGETSID